jgi:hypothetical protein
MAAPRRGRYARGRVRNAGEQRRADRVRRPHLVSSREDEFEMKQSRIQRRGRILQEGADAYPLALERRNFAAAVVSPRWNTSRGFLCV